MGRQERFENLERRTRACRPKDAVILPILRSIPIPDPSRFTALLMPCLHGPELGHFRGRGVPWANMIAIERDRSRWKAMHATLHVDVGPRPMEANERLDHVHAERPGGFDVIYLDFNGQPGWSHRDALLKVFRLRILKPISTLILTFGLTRTDRGTKDLNRMLTQRTGCRLPTEIDVAGALEAADHPRPSDVERHEYRSMFTERTGLWYVTNVFRFGYKSGGGTE